MSDDYSVPEFVRNPDYSRTAHRYWIPSRTERVLAIVSIVCAVVIGWLLGQDNGYRDGARDGIRYGTTKVCEVIPHSQDWTERCH